MITAAVFVPSTPMLVPAVSCGAAAELDDVRDAAITALREALVPGASRVVVVGAGTTTCRHAHGTGTFRGFGVELDVPLDPAVAGSERLPLALTIGAWLLTQVGWHGDRVALEVYAASEDPTLDAAGAALAAEREPTVLLVVADGSAARSEKAPASLHPDAAAFDSAVSAALAAGAPAALAALGRDLALAVTAAGRPAWRVAAAALEGSAYDAVLLADTAPYGVGYLVARWLRA